METKIIKGVWHSFNIETVSTNRSFVRTENEDGLIVVCEIKWNGNFEEMKATANAIAALPDLLHAAIFYLQTFENDDPQGMTAEAIFHNFNDAVKKALNW